MNVVRARGVTDTGRKRRRNEDDFVCDPPLFAVADGMGGAQAGELASNLAAAAVREEGEDDELAGEERVVSLIQEANRRVYQRSSEDAAVSGMGTTMTVALVENSRVAIGHVGDSRAYLVRDGRLEQLTDDHSLVAELVRNGKLSPEEAETHPQRSVITRALGTDPDVDVDTFTILAEERDLFLLCSDGLTTMVDDDAILEIVEDNRDDLDSALRALVVAANRSGGEDNITVVAFELGEAEVLEETRSYPVTDTESVQMDEEDTLSGLEVPPAVDTMIVPADRVREHLETLAAADESASEGERGAPEPEPTADEPGSAGLRLLLLLLVLIVAAVLLILWLVGRL